MTDQREADDPLVVAAHEHDARLITVGFHVIRDANDQLDFRPGARPMSGEEKVIDLMVALKESLAKHRAANPETAQPESNYRPRVRCSACGIEAPAGRLTPGLKHHDGGTWEEIVG